MARPGRSVVSCRQHQHPERGALLLCGYILDKSHEIFCHRRVLKEFAIVYLLEGAGTYEDELTERRAVKSGDVLLLFPDVEHSYGRAEGQRWSECYLVFQGNLFHQLERDGLIDRRQPVLSPGLTPALTGAFAGIIGDHQLAKRGSDAIFAARIHLLLAEIVERHRRQSGDEHDRAALARALLEEQLHRRIDLEQVARRLGMSYENFRKFFSREIGVPPAQYRAQRRVDEAKRLLLEGRLTLTEIAGKLGYCDHYFFARQFKQLTKQSPGAFRRNFLANRSGR